MKKIFVFVFFMLMAFNAFSFDINKDNFVIGLDEETALFIYKDKIYISGWDEKLSVQERPAEILNENGYSVLHLKENPYMYGYSKDGEGIFLIDLRGSFIPITFKKNAVPGQNRDLWYMYGNIKNIKASSELTENSKSGKTVYSVENVLCVGSEKEEGVFMRACGVPWVPDILQDKNPYIDVELNDCNINTIYMLPGFVDFSRQYLWKQNARPKTVEVIDMKTSESLGKFTIEDAIKFTEINLPHAVTKIRIKFIDFYPGTKYKDPCVAAIYFGNDRWIYKGNYGQSVFEEDGYFWKLNVPSSAQ